MNPDVTPETIELELKFGFPGGSADAVERALIGVDLSFECRGTQTLYNQYYDTADGLCHQNGVAVRVRSIDTAHEMTVKIRKPDEGGLTQRQEWNRPIETSQLAQTALLDLPLPTSVRSAIQSHRLKPIYTNTFRRSDWRVLYQGTALMVSLDQGTATVEARHSPISELEIELIEGDVDRLVEASLKLCDALPVFMAVISKAERGESLVRQKTPVLVSETAPEKARLYAIARALDPLLGPDFGYAKSGLKSLGFTDATALECLDAKQIPHGLARWMVEKSQEFHGDTL